MSEEVNVPVERAFITRFVPGVGFKFEPIGDIPEREIFAMMDGAVRQVSHARLTAIENAVMQQSHILKGLVAIIQEPTTAAVDESGGE